MSKFDLRDVSERLAGSRDTEAVVFEFLGYLQGLEPDWRASLAFYEVSSDSLVKLYQRHGARLDRRDLELKVDQLPARLVRKFFHPNAFFNPIDRRSVLAQLLHTSSAYEPDPAEASLVHPLVPLAGWSWCVFLALADQEDVLALLTLASDRKGAFGTRAMGEILPVKSIAAMAIAQHLRRGRGPVREGPEPISAATFQERILELTARAQELEAENRRKSERLLELAREIERLDTADQSRELDRVKEALVALEEQTMVATRHLDHAYNQLATTTSRLESAERTLTFLRDVFRLLGQDHDSEQLPRLIVQWFCERFELGRCSLMLVDGGQDTLSIAAQQGIDPGVANAIRVRVGQGVAGWVAHHRRPLLVRAKGEDAPHTGLDTYNSDSFVSVPLMHGNRLHGVLNLSNKRDGEPFEDLDLERALMAGSVVALALGARESRRAAQEPRLTVRAASA